VTSSGEIGLGIGNVHLIQTGALVFLRGCMEKYFGGVGVRKIIVKEFK